MASIEEARRVWKARSKPPSGRTLWCIPSYSRAKKTPATTADLVFRGREADPWVAVADLWAAKAAVEEDRDIRRSNDQTARRFWNAFRRRPAGGSLKFRRSSQSSRFT